MKVIIIHENREWLPPIRKALERIGMEVLEMDFSFDQTFDLNATPEKAIYFNRISPSAFSRNNSHAPAQAYQYLCYLESYGACIINKSHTVQMEVSKIKQNIALKKAHIATPATKVYTSLPRLKESKHKYPFIVKYNSGGKGIGVTKIEDQYMLDQFCEQKHDSIDGIFLAQDFIESKDPYITRAEFIGGRFVYAVNINNQGSFELCPADVCQVGDMFCPVGEQQDNKFTIIEAIDEKLRTKFEAFLKQNDIQVAGIEFIVDINDQVYAYDVNLNTNYNQKAEQEFGLSAYDVLANYIKKAYIEYVL